MTIITEFNSEFNLNIIGQKKFRFDYVNITSCVSKIPTKFHTYQHSCHGMCKILLRSNQFSVDYHQDDKYRQIKNLVKITYSDEY